MSTAQERAARNERALELHLAGASYQKIATALGFASKSSAHEAVQKALASSRPVTIAGEALETELARLDAMLVGLWAAARRGNVAAVDRVLKIMERRSKYLGLDSRGAAADHDHQESARSMLSSVADGLRAVYGQIKAEDAAVGAPAEPDA